MKGFDLKLSISYECWRLIVLSQLPLSLCEMLTNTHSDYKSTKDALRMKETSTNDTANDLCKLL